MSGLHYRILISDVDGVMNDGKLLIGPDGEESHKYFHVKDGMGIKLLQKFGVIFAVISGRGSAPLKGRMDQLGVKELHMRVDDKKSVLKDLLNRYQVDPARAVYIGDDINDLSAQKMIQQGGGLFCCPVDAVTEVIRKADLVLSKKGGEGVLRELIDLLLNNELPFVTQNVSGQNDF